MKSVDGVCCMLYFSNEPSFFLLLSSMKAIRSRVCRPLGWVSRSAIFVDRTHSQLYIAALKAHSIDSSAYSHLAVVVVVHAGHLSVVTDTVPARGTSWIA